MGLLPVSLAHAHQKIQEARATSSKLYMALGEASFALEVAHLSARELEEEKSR